MKRYAYYKGCLASLSAKELEAEGAHRDVPEITPGEEPPVAEG